MLPKQPNTVLARGQLGIADRVLEPTTLWLDVWSGFEFLAAQVRSVPNESDRPTAIVSNVGADAPVECKSPYKPQ